MNVPIENNVIQNAKKLLVASCVQCETKDAASRRASVGVKPPKVGKVKVHIYPQRSRFTFLSSRTYLSLLQKTM